MSTIKAGTYVFKQTITNPTSNINVANFTEVKGYYLTANNTYVSAPEDITDWNLTPNGCTFSPGGKANNMNNWTTSFYDFSSGSLVTYTANDTKLLRTIIVTADQTNVSEAFYNWFMSNIETTPTTKLIKIKFKDTISPTEFSIDINFLSNGVSYTQMSANGKIQLLYNSTIAFNGDEWNDTAYQYIEIDPTQANFNAFITEMKSNIEGVELEAGTYVWVNVLETLDIPLNCSINFISNNVDYTSISNGASNLNRIYYNGNNRVTAYNNSTWTNDAYKTITTTENQYVSFDFYNYAILGNQLVKQGSTPTYTFKHWKKSNVKVNEQSTETWLFNSPMSDMMTNKEINITFTSNGETFTQLAIRLNKGIMNYVKSDGTSVGAYEDGWAGNPQYQTITVDTRQTNYQELRTFLNSNASIQSSNKYYFKPYTILGLYTITTTLTNCTGASANATKIQENGGLTLTFTANSGYELPTGVSVTNVTSYNWNKSTGVLAISKPTGDVSIEIVAVSALPQLTTPTNVAVTDTTLTFDEVANATSYEVFVDNVSIGTHSIVSSIVNPTYSLISGVIPSNYSVASINDLSKVESKITSDSAKYVFNNYQTMTLTEIWNNLGISLSNEIKDNYQNVIDLNNCNKLTNTCSIFCFENETSNTYSFDSEGSLTIQVSATETMTTNTKLVIIRPNGSVDFMTIEGKDEENEGRIGEYVIQSLGIAFLIEETIPEPEQRNLTIVDIFGQLTITINGEDVDLGTTLPRNITTTFTDGDMIWVGFTGSATGTVPIVINDVQYTTDETITLKRTDITVKAESEGSGHFEVDIDTN
jgi:hypothetical protein